MRSVASTCADSSMSMRTKLPTPRRVRDELGEVAVRELLVDREAEVRELERDVRPQPFGLDAVEQLAVRGDDRARLGLVAHALAEQRRVRQEAVVVQPPQDRDRCVEALAGDEARGAEPEAVPLDEALQPRAVGAARMQAAERRSRESQAGDDPLDLARSASVSPRSGARTSGPTGTPRRPSTVFDAAWKGKRCEFAPAAPSAFSCASAVGSRTSGTTASGKLAARPETAPAAPAASPRSSSASGADEDVEPLEEVRLEPLPRAVRDLHPDEVRRALAQPLDHRQRDRVAAPRLELVEVERQRRAGARGRLEVREQLGLVEREVRRRDHGDGVGAGRGCVLGEARPCRRVVCAPTWTATWSRPRAASTNAAAISRRSSGEKSTPSPVVPSASTPSRPCPARKSTYGGTAARSNTPSLSGVTAAASAPLSMARL